MPKTPSTKLFELIQSLSSSEKRYFKVFATKTSTSNSNKYLVLFDAIDRQVEYKEESLKVLIYNKKEIESRKFSELKHYLYELILKSLQAYDEKTSIDYKLKSMLNNIRVLFKRSLYSHCVDILQKIKKIAYQYDKFLIILEVLFWEKRLAYTESNISFLNENLGRINTEEQDLLKKITQERHYWTIFFQLLISLKKDGIARSSEKTTELTSIMNSDWLLEKNYPDFHQAQLLYHRIYSIYYSSIREYEQYYATNNQLIELMEEQPKRLKEDVSTYISVITNQIFSSGMLRKYDKVEQNLEKLHSLKPITIDDKYKIFLHYYLNKMVLCSENGNFELGVQLIEQREKERQQFKKALFNINYSFIYSYLFFGAGRYEDALHWLNQLLNYSGKIQRQDLQSVARIIQIIIHYELNNSILLEHLLRSTYRYMRRRNRLYQFELRILKFIKRSSNIITKKALREEFIKLRDDFLELSKDPKESPMLRYFDFISWLESKIEEKTFPEVIKEKYLIKEIN